MTIVAEDKLGIAGYIVGAYDTATFEARLEREWWPARRDQYADPAGDPSGWTADERRSFAINHPHTMWEDRRVLSGPYPHEPDATPAGSGCWKPSSGALNI
jgi:hypothetical protein